MSWCVGTVVALRDQSPTARSILLEVIVRTYHAHAKTGELDCLDDEIPY